MTYHSTARIPGAAPGIRRWVHASLVALAVGLVGCGSTPPEHDSIDLTQLGYGVVDGHFTPLDVEKAGRLRQAAGGDLDLFVDPPSDAALLFGVPDGLAPASFAVSVRTDDGEHAVHLQHEDGGGYRAALGDLAGRSTEIRLTNRSSGPLTWIRPRVEGTFAPPTPSFTPAPRPSGKRYNVLLYVIDTLRADHLTCYGYHRATTPRIDEYASHGTLFENAYSMASSTAPSMSSVFASRHPSEIRSHLDPKGAARETLGEAFQRAGWATAGFQANLLLRRPLGFARGFDHYEIPTRRPFKKVKPVRAEQLHERVLAWLAKRPAKPFFMWVQSMDVHEYDPVPPFAGRYTNPTHATTTTTRLEDVDNAYLMLGRFTPEYYDETLAYADHFLGKLLDDLRAQGILQDTIVIITADHGEPLGEHDTYFHGVNVYEEVIHVPLVVLLPWDATPRRIPRLTSLLDLAPTLTALAGVPTPPGWEGRSLLAPPAPHARTIAFGVTEGRQNKDPSWFLRTGPWKVVMDRKQSRLFDLRTDPDEMTDVAHQHPVTAQDLFSLLVSRTPEFRKGWKQPPPWDADLNPAQKARLHEALQALGYVH